jgi:small subunit ribosomal protein S17
MAEQEDTTTDETADAPQTPATETPEATADPTPEETVAETAPAPEAPAHAEPQEVLAPKERRARARAAKAGKAPARGPRTDEERQADRVVARAKAAGARRTSRAKATVKHKSQAHNRTATPPREHVEGRQKVRQGIVVSDKADKTITVRIDVARRHPKYEKIVRTSMTLHAHDESNDAHIGDTVTVREARPLSRLKRWRLIGVVERAK